MFPRDAAAIGKLGRDGMIDAAPSPGRGYGNNQADNNGNDGTFAGPASLH
jgi:hypothetical protein